MKQVGFSTMKDIGATRGQTSHEIGKALEGLGLRDGSYPSQEAIRLGLAKQQWYDDVEVYGWVWQVDEIGRLLDGMTANSDPVA